MCGSSSRYNANVLAIIQQISEKMSAFGSLSRRALVYFTTAFVAMGVVVVALQRSRSDLDTSVAADCVKRGTDTEQTRCLKRYSHDAARSGKTRAALHTLTKFVRTGMLDDCHHLAHDLGHAEFEIQGNFISAIRAGDASCLKGYYHGVVTAAVHHAASMGRLDVAKMCTALDGDDAAYDGCVHGLGHGLMSLFEDMTRARQACASLSGAAVGRCIDGLFMENAMRYIDLSEEDYRRSAPRACDRPTLPKAEVDLCNMEIGEIAMFHYRHDLPAALELCRAIEDRSASGACEQGARQELKTWERGRQEGRRQS